MPYTDGHPKVIELSKNILTRKNEEKLLKLISDQQPAASNPIANSLKINGL